MRNEKVTLINAYVQTSDRETGKWDVMGLMHSNWAGNYWEVQGTFDTEDLAVQYKSKLIPVENARKTEK